MSQKPQGCKVTWRVRPQQQAVSPLKLEWGLHISIRLPCSRTIWGFNSAQHETTAEGFFYYRHQKWRCYETGRRGRLDEFLGHHANTDNQTSVALRKDTHAHTRTRMQICTRKVTFKHKHANKLHNFYIRAETLVNKPAATKHLQFISYIFINQTIINNYKCRVQSRGFMNNLKLESRFIWVDPFLKPSQTPLTTFTASKFRSDRLLLVNFDVLKLTVSPFGFKNNISDK